MRKRPVLALALALAAMVLLGTSLWAQEEVVRKVKYQVKPAYPTLARQLNLTGTVKIEVVIAADGKVKSTRVLGGHPLLVDAALDAIKQWKYEPAPKETTHIVQFKFVRPEE